MPETLLAELDTPTDTFVIQNKPPHPVVVYRQVTWNIPTDIYEKLVAIKEKAAKPEIGIAVNGVLVKNMTEQDFGITLIQVGIDVLSQTIPETKPLIEIPKIGWELSAAINKKI